MGLKISDARNFIENELRSIVHGIPVERICQRENQAGKSKQKFYEMKHALYKRTNKQIVSIRLTEREWKNLITK